MMIRITDAISIDESELTESFVRASGPTVGHYRRVDSGAKAGTVERDFFDGMDTSLPAVFAMLGRPEPALADGRHVRRLAQPPEHLDEPGVGLVLGVPRGALDRLPELDGGQLQLPVADALRITREDADALEYAHKQG